MTDKTAVSPDILDLELEEAHSGFRTFLKRLFKNKGAVFGLVIILALILSAIFAPWIAPYRYDTQSLANMLQKPSATHLLGTDEFGRDVFSRIVYGSRISIQIGFIAVGLSLVVGTSGRHRRLLPGCRRLHHLRNH
jgi:peptide/nickel transport system permease protein